VTKNSMPSILLLRSCLVTVSNSHAWARLSRLPDYPLWRPFLVRKRNKRNNAVFMRGCAGFGRRNIRALFPLFDDERSQYLCGSFRMFPIRPQVAGESRFQLR
jgi:hypothetical protein